MQAINTSKIADLFSYVDQKRPYNTHRSPFLVMSCEAAELYLVLSITLNY